MKTIGVLIALAFVLASEPLSVLAESHWDRRQPGRAYLFRDTKARYVGDLVTVMIAEETAVTNRENRQLDHQAEEGGGGSFTGETDGGFGEQGSSGSLDLSGNSDRSLSGTATYRSDRQFEDMLTVVIVEVLPSGNFVVRGRSDTVMIDGEHRSVTLSGVIRPIDIGPDNSISSRYLTDMQLLYEGEGPETQQLQQGWFSKTLNWLNPF